jgi:arylsulfatase A-like enzyme
MKVKKIAFFLNFFLIVLSINGQNKKNILFIAVDDLKPILSCYGDEKVKTPNIDRLANRGTVFLNNHSQFAVCGPSRASLMTGLMPEETGVTSFVKMRHNVNAQLTDLITLPQHFKNNGYETAATGKINDSRCVGSINEDGTVNGDGNIVDDPPSWSIPYVKAGAGYQGQSAPKQGVTSVTLKKAVGNIDDLDENFPDGKVLNKALDLLNDLASGDKPFFLGVGFKKPHLPFVAPTKYWELYERNDFSTALNQEGIINDSGYVLNSVEELRNKYYFETDENGYAIPLNGDVFTDERQKELIHGYYACVSHIDALIGQLLDELSNLGLNDNTIIVLWGDHGFHLGDHNRWGKHTVLEQATRSPLIIVSPEHFGGQSTQSPTTFLDVYPTLCDLNGLDQPEQPLSSTQTNGRHLSGKSLIPILNDPSSSVQMGAVSTIYPKNGARGYAYRTKDFRYIEWIKNGEVVAQDLFDFAMDPNENENLAPRTDYETAQIMHELSTAMRVDGECEGCEILKASTPVSAPALNEAPVWGQTSYTRSAEAGFNFTVFLNWAVLDKENDPLVYTLESGPDWLSIVNSSLCKLSGSPTVNHVGLNSFIIGVSDGFNAKTYATLQVNVDGENASPEWTKNIYTKSAIAGDNFSTFMNWASSDMDGDTLTYAIISGPEWLKMENPGNCKLSGTPSDSDFGENEFTISVSDGINLPVSMTMRVTVSQ